MSAFLHALGQYPFLQHALLGGLLASVGCGVVGSYVVVRRIGFLAGGVAHSVLGGMGAALYYGGDPLLGALAAAVLAALAIGLVARYWREQVDTLIAAIWAVGMAVGILFISRTPGYDTELMSYLFGNILMVTPGELWLMAALDGVLLGIVALYYKGLLAVIFDEEFATLRNLPVTALFLLLLLMVALTVVLLIQVVGLILVIALLTLPAAIAGHYTHTLRHMMLGATALGMLFTSSGLALSYGPDLPSGATIIVVAGLAYLASALISRALRQWRARRVAVER